MASGIAPGVRRAASGAAQGRDGEELSEVYGSETMGARYLVIRDCWPGGAAVPAEG
ncbi:MAG: hypothetical protein U0133_01305 [Gemmatimonadales bacterium]